MWPPTLTKIDRPLLEPDPGPTFVCPVSGRAVAWAAKDVFNPAATLHDGAVHLLVRAEDAVGRNKGTSRLGLAVSTDGEHFTLRPEPVLVPDRDAWFTDEWSGGCEDPRLTVLPDGRFLLTYTAFDGTLAQLMVATSTDLRTWVKHGPAFAATSGGRYRWHWAKSGAVLSRWTPHGDGERLEAVRLHDRYWMYWGEGVLFAATSVDGIGWEPVEHRTGHARVVSLGPDGAWHNRDMPDGGTALLPVMRPRPHRFDAQLVEPGPAAVLDGDTITLWYNGSRPGADAGRYSVGVVRFDAHEPTSVIARPTRPVLEPDRPWEASGQNAAVVFGEGLVRWQGRELLYYGCADSRVGAAVIG